MQNDSESVPEDVLQTLVADGQTAAPGESRARVLARLGVAAAAGAAALAHGSVASAAAAKAAGHSAAPATASVLGFGVAKVLLAHPVIGIVATLAVGSGVGIGAYQAFEPGPAPPSLATPQAAPAKKSEPAPAATPAHGARLRAAPVTPGPEASPPAVPETLAATPAPSRAPNAPSASSASTVKEPAPAELAPGPELPENAESARLAEQQTLLDQARASLRRGDGPGALAVIAGHESLYPVTEFAEERAAIRILALVMSGQGSEARAHAERFRLRFPTSLFLPAIEKSLAPVVQPPAPTPHDSPKPE